MTNMLMDTWRILHECSYFIEFIKPVEEKILNKRLVEFNKFKNTGAQMLDSIYHMTLKLF